MNNPTRVSTEFVRRHYAHGPTAYREDGSVAKMPTAADVEYAERQFDQWLAAHDAALVDALSAPPADDVREALDGVHYCPQHGDMLAPLDDRDVRSIRCVETHTVEQIVAAFEVRPRGTVTDAERFAAALRAIADGDAPVFVREFARDALEAAREARS